jgi:hypothetical protein
VVVYKFHTSPVDEVKGFWHGTLIHGRSMGILLALLCGFTIGADHDQPAIASVHAHPADQFSA